MVRMGSTSISGIPSRRLTLFIRTAYTFILVFSMRTAVSAVDFPDGMNLRDSMGRTPLMRALWYNHDDIVYRLLALGADTEIPDINGQTALYMALQFTDDPDTVNALLSAGARVNVQDKRGRSPMEVLITRGKDFRYARLLLNRGVKPLPGSRGESLYFAALDRPSPEERSVYLESLFEAGYSLDDKNSSGRSPREEALFREDSSSAALLAELRETLCTSLIRELDERGAGTDIATVESLLNRGALPAFRNSSGYNACHYAVAAGRPDILRLLLSRSMTPPFADDPPELQNMILRFPLEYDKVTARDLLEILFNQGMNPEARGEDGTTLLIRGITHSYTAAALILHRGADPNRLNPGGVSPLMTALTVNLENKVKFLRELVQAGGDLTARDDQGLDVFTYAILYRNSPEVIRALVELGIDPDRRDDYGTPGFFWAAAYSEDLDLVQMLIPTPGKASWQDKDGWTPLMGALSFGNSPEIVSYLSDLTPDGRITDGTGRGLKEFREVYREHFFPVPTELDQLINRKRVYPVDDIPYGDLLNESLTEVVRWGREPEILSKLIDAGAKTEYRDTAGFDSIMAASAYGSPDLIMSLIREGASVFSVTDYGWTPLHVAAWSSHPETVKLLVREGLDVNVRDFENWTPFLWAVRNGASLEYLQTLTALGADPGVRSYTGDSALHLACSGWIEPDDETLKFLLNTGIPVNSMNRKGETALSLAAAMGYDRVCSLLIEYGADPDIAPGLSK